MSTRHVVFKVWAGEPEGEEPFETSLIVLDPLDDGYFEDAAEAWADRAGLDESEWQDGDLYVTVEADGIRKKVYLEPEYSVNWNAQVQE